MLDREKLREKVLPLAGNLNDREIDKLFFLTPYGWVPISGLKSEGDIIRVSWQAPAAKQEPTKQEQEPAK